MHYSLVRWVIWTPPVICKLSCARDALITPRRCLFCEMGWDSILIEKHDFLSFFQITAWNGS